MPKNIAPPDPELKVNPAKIMRLPKTQEERQLVGNLSKITDVFKEMYKDQKNAKLVREVLASRISGDKAIYLRDLLLENSSLKGKLNRDVFEVMNTADQGHGKRGGWSIRNGTSLVTFTMWHKIFTGS